MKPNKHRLHRLLKPITQILFISILLLPFTIYQLLITDAYAEIPRLINYQGRLTDSQGRSVTDGTYKITFRIYDASSGGTLLWESIYNPGLTGSRSVRIEKGLFNEMLGEFNNGSGRYKELKDIPFDKQYYLEIVMEGEVMSPRQLLTSSTYALSIRANERAQSQTYTLINLRISSEY